MVAWTLAQSTARLLIRAGVASRRRGAYATAVALLRAALTVERSCHVRVFALNEIGMACKYAGRFDDAGAAYRSALAHHPPRPTVADILHNLAGFAHARGEPAEAVRLARAGVAVRAVPDTHPAAISDAGALAAILLDLGEVDEAEQMLENVIARLLEDGTSGLEAAVAIANLGTVLYRRDRLPLAIRLYEHALSMKARCLGPAHVDLAATYLNLGTALYRTGAVDEAVVAFTTATSLLEGRVSRDNRVLLTSRRYLEAIAENRASRYARTDT